MNKFELDVIDSCIKLLSIDGIGSKVLVRRTLEALKSNELFNFSKTDIKCINRGTKP